MGEHKRVNDLLDEAIACIEQGKFDCLEGISDQIISESAILQDKHYTNIAVGIFSLYKIFELNRDTAMRNQFVVLLKDLSKQLKGNNMSKYNFTISKLFNLISSYDTRLRVFIMEVLDKAHVKKGSQLHGKGISLGRAAHLMGISLWELSSYVGKTKVHEEDEIIDIKAVKNRLGLARGLFI